MSTKMTVKGYHQISEQSSNAYQQPESQAETQVYNHTRLNDSFYSKSGKSGENHNSNGWLDRKKRLKDY